MKQKVLPKRTVSRKLAEQAAVAPTPIGSGEASFRRFRAAPQALGSTGTSINSGLFSEEYLRDLTGLDAADRYDKMRRSDAVVRMCLSAVKNPIKTATWTVEAAGDEADYERHAEFVEHILFRDMDKNWKLKLQEILSCVDFGYSLFEITHKSVVGHPEFGSYTGIEIRGMRA